MSKTSYILGSIGLNWLTILFSAFGYFVYDGIAGVFGVLIFSILNSFTTYIGLVPFIGVGLYFWLAQNVVGPWTFSFTGITSSWVTSIIFWIGFIFAALYTIIGTLLALLVVKKHWR